VAGSATVLDKAGRTGAGVVEVELDTWLLCSERAPDNSSCRPRAKMCG